MAHARQAERAVFQAPGYLIAVVIAALLVVGILAFTVIDPLRPAPSAQSPAVNPAVLKAEALWELQRKLQSGDLDPASEAARAWERQRRILSGAFE